VYRFFSNGMCKIWIIQKKKKLSTSQHGYDYE